MTLRRRDLLRGLGSLGAAAALDSLDVAGARPADAQSPNPGFPRRSDFRIRRGWTYLNGAYTHPMPIAVAAAYRAAVERRSTVGPPASASAPAAAARTAFAELINARPSEIAFLPNTSTGENLVAEGLGLGRMDGNVVTDALHFEGALIHLYELQKRGLDLRVVMPREGRIELRDLERVVDRKTRLVEVSLVAMYNGFQHDLKAVCDLAHAHGAYVYADITQGAGAVPFDVRACGVDFAATASYKWLMGDFGLGFLYVREDLLGRVFERPHWSYMSATAADIHLAPTDPLSPGPVSWTPGGAASHHAELGTMAYAVGAALAVSIPYLQRLGVASIQRHRQPLIDRIQRELPRLGFIPQTPLESMSPIVTFAHRNAETIERKLARARISVRVAPHWIRIAPSVFNDMQDVERLLEALS